MSAIPTLSSDYEEGSAATLSLPLSAFTWESSTVKLLANWLANIFCNAIHRKVLKVWLLETEDQTPQHSEVMSVWPSSKWNLSFTLSFAQQLMKRRCSGKINDGGWKLKRREDISAIWAFPRGPFSLGYQSPIHLPQCFSCYFNHSKTERWEEGEYCRAGWNTSCKLVSPQS